MTYIRQPNLHLPHLCFFPHLQPSSPFSQQKLLLSSLLTPHTLPNLRPHVDFTYNLCISDYRIERSCPGTSSLYLQLPVIYFTENSNSTYHTLHSASYTTHLIFRVDAITPTELPKPEKPRLSLTPASSLSCLSYNDEHFCLHLLIVSKSHRLLSISVFSLWIISGHYNP